MLISSATKRLMFRFFSLQVTPIYPLCHKLLTISSCSGSSPLVVAFYTLIIILGLIHNEQTQSSSKLHALSHKHKHTQDNRRATEVALKTNKSEAAGGLNF
jgi:hypothetical protein